MKPFRFGLIGTGMASKKAWEEQARRAEATGFATLLVPDHFPLPLAPVPAMLAAANATTTLRVGSYVFDNDFRHPAVLAKEAATLDVLTEGRLELGLGAGWMQAEYEMTGIPFDSGKIRLERLTEAVQVIKGLFADGSVDFEGTHYTIRGLEGSPKPVQRPLPIQIGGGGKRMLGLAATEASIVGIVAQAKAGEIDWNGMGDDITGQRVEWVRQAAGDRFGELELNVVVFAARLTDDRSHTAEEIAPGFQMDPAQLLNSTHHLLGTREQMREQLLRLREAYGISYFAFFDTDLAAVESIVTELAYQ